MAFVPLLRARFTVAPAVCPASASNDFVADAHRDPFAEHRPEAVELRLHVVAPRVEVPHLVEALRVGDRDSRDVRPNVGHRNGDARQYSARDVLDDAADFTAEVLGEKGKGKKKESEDYEHRRNPELLLHDISSAREVRLLPCVIADVLYDHIDSRVKALYDHFTKVHNGAGSLHPGRRSPLPPLFLPRFPR